VINGIINGIMLLLYSIKALCNVTVGDNFPVLVGENFPVSCP